MDAFLIELIGFSAGFLTTIAGIPQAIKSWKTKSTKDLSLPMYVMIWIGVFLWLIYGILTNSLPLIAANSVTLLLISSILIMKLKFG